MQRPREIEFVVGMSLGEPFVQFYGLSGRRKGIVRPAQPMESDPEGGERRGEFAFVAIRIGLSCSLVDLRSALERWQCFICPAELQEVDPDVFERVGEGRSLILGISSPQSSAQVDGALDNGRCVDRPPHGPGLERVAHEVLHGSAHCQTTHRPCDYPPHGRVEYERGEENGHGKDENRPDAKPWWFRGPPRVFRRYCQPHARNVPDWATAGARTRSGVNSCR